MPKLFFAIDHIPAEIVDPAEVTGETHFNAAAELAHHLGFGTFVFSHESAAADRNERSCSPPPKMPPKPPNT